MRSGHFHHSAPHIYANVLGRLLIEPGDSFLNCGSGMGYLNCLAAVLQGVAGHLTQSLAYRLSY